MPRLVPKINRFAILGNEFQESSGWERSLTARINVSVVSMIGIIITSFAGMFAISAALEGYLLCEMHWITRIACAVGGLLMMIPGSVTDLIGVGLLVLVLLIEKFGGEKLRAVL